MKNINVEKLVSDIKSGEQAYKSGEWYSWCKGRELGELWRGVHYPVSYADHMTALYTLRAFLRGKVHRRNAPAPLRDFHRSMIEQGIDHKLEWDMEEHNQRVAERISAKYRIEEAA